MSTAWRDVVAILTRLFGARHLDLIEECAQEALLRALEVWPYQGEPANQTAWLVQTAKRKLVDRLRRERSVELSEQAAADDAPPEAVPDDRLAMMFLCCHPALAPETQVAVTLQVVCGLNARDIGAAFLLPEATVAQRLVRAKRQIREQGLRFEMPTDLAGRLEPVLAVVYLLFNAGYSASPARPDLCDEALYLTALLATTEQPAAHALAALVHLQASRLATRGTLLAEQDRAHWDAALVAKGLRYFERSMSGDRLARYHVEAAIAVEHAVAPSFAETNWPLIVAHYDDLLRLAPGPVVELNRAIAIGYRDGPAAGLKLLRELEHEPALRSYALLREAIAAFR